MEKLLTDLLQALARHDGLSTARAARRLGIGQSQLLRLISATGSDETFGGLGLIRVEDTGERCLLYITECGQQYLQQQV